MSCSDLRNKFVLNKSSCNNLCDDSNGSPTKCNFDCDMECAHAGSSGGGGSSSNFQMVYDNCYSQHCGSSVGCEDLSIVLDCCKANCNKNPVCIDVCSSNNANKGRPADPVDRSKAYRYFMDCAASVSGDDNEHDKAIECCASKCGNDAGCRSDCANFAIGYYKSKNPVKPSPYNPSPDGPSPDGPSPDGPSPDGPSPDGPSPDKPIILVKKPDNVLSNITTPMWWGIGLGIAIIVIFIIAFVIHSRKAVASKFGFRFY